MSARERRAKARRRAARLATRLVAPATIVTAFGTAAPLLGTAQAAANPLALGNLVTTPVASLPQQPTQAGANLYFSAALPDTGRELFVANGSGSSLVDDLDPGLYGSDPTELTNAGGTLFFLADPDATSAQADAGAEELYATHGTASTTVALTSAGAGADASYLVDVGASVYFVSEATGTPELWTSNGTVAGTHQVNLPSGVTLTDDGVGSYGAPIGSNGSDLFFTASTAAGPTPQLFASNGTTAGTVQLTDDPANSYLTIAANAGGEVYFVAANAAGAELFDTNGTAGGTAELNASSAAGSLADFTAVGNQLYFVLTAEFGAGGAETSELFSTNGAAAATEVPANLSYLQDLTNVSGTLYFAAQGTSEGLYTATPNAVTLVSNAPSSISALVNAGGTLYFAGSSSVNGASQTGIFSSDGTAAGTSFIAATNGYVAGDLANLGTTAYFTASSPSAANAAQTDLWSTDGTDLTQADAAIVAGVTQGSYPTDFTPAGGLTFFLANPHTATIPPAVDPSPVNGLYRSDATTNGTLALGAANGATLDPLALANAGGTLFFTSGPAPDTLWSSNGNSAGTALVDVGDATDVDTIYGGGSELYFTAQNAADTAGTPGAGTDQLWATNAGAGGAVQLTDLTGAGATTGYALPGDDLFGTPDLVTIGSQTYFLLTSSGANASQLWRTDGTVAGTSELTTIPAAGAFALTAAGGELYFTVDGSAGTELWGSNGTSAGTAELSALSVDGTTYFGAGLTDPVDVDGQLFFSHPGGLWTSNGTAAGTGVVLATTDNLTGLTNVDGELYFSQTNTGDGQGLGEDPGPDELYEANPTSCPTPVKRFAAIDGLANDNGVLAFGADDDADGLELWTSNGAAAGTQRVSDIWPGSGSALDPALDGAGSSTDGPELTGAGNGLFFAADDGIDGVEPYVDTNAAVDGAPSPSGAGLGACLSQTSTAPGPGTTSSTTPTSTPSTSTSTPSASTPTTNPSTPTTAPSTATPGQPKSTTTTTTSSPPKPTTSTPPATPPATRTSPTVTRLPTVTISTPAAGATSVTFAVTCPAGSAACTVNATLTLVEVFTHGRLTALKERERAEPATRRKVTKRTVTLARGRLTLRPGRRGTLKLELTTAGKALLTQRGEITPVLKVTDGAKTVTSRAVTFRVKRTKRK